jgi:hypothetical protein
MTPYLRTIDGSRPVFHGSAGKYSEAIYARTIYISDSQYPSVLLPFADKTYLPSPDVFPSFIFEIHKRD